MNSKEQITKIDTISPYILPVLVSIGDYLAIVLSETLAFHLCDLITPYKFYLDIPRAYFYIWIPAVFIFFLFYAGANKRMTPYWEVIKNILSANFYSIIAAIFILYLIHEDITRISRLYVISLFILAFIFICIIRRIIIGICNYMDILKEPVIFIGGGKVTEAIIKFYNNNNCFGIRIVGIIDDDFSSEYLRKKYPLLKGLDTAAQYIKDSGVRTVIIAKTRLGKDSLIKLITNIQTIVRNISFIPNIIGTPIANLDIRRIYREDMVL